MEIFSASRPPAAAGPQAGDSARERMVSSDFETFLRMLTTQMQNQDPLNPMEATDFAVQLATFSGVEQAVRTNQLLEGILSQSTIGELAGLVGMTVRSPGAARFDGTGVALTLPALDEADSARLLVRDAMGGLVDSENVSTAGGAHVWRGLGADGMPLPSGTYRFEVVGEAAGLPVEGGPVESYGEVIEARRDGDTTMLILAGGREVSLSEVTALRRGSALP